MYDLSKADHSITARVESLISRMDSMSEAAIKSEFISILNDEETAVSDKTKAYWTGEVAKCSGKTSLMYSITNLHLAGCNLRVNPKTH